MKKLLLLTLLGLGACGKSIKTKALATTTPPPQRVNEAPNVSAGNNKTITLPAIASMTGTVSDDGENEPSSTLLLEWVKVSGPGTVSFSHPTEISTTASFSVAGTYTLRLIANDGELDAFDDMLVFVNPAVVTVPATKLVLNGPSSVAAGNCSSAFTVIAQDANNIERVVSTSPLTINGLGTAVVYTNSSCTNAGSIHIASGASRSTFYIKDTAYDRDALPLTLNLSAQTPGLSVSNTLSFTQNPGAASRLVFATQPSPTGTAEALLHTQPVVKVVDAFSNKVSTFTGNVTLTASTDPTCGTNGGGILFGGEIPANEGVASYSLVKYTLPGTIYLKASATGLTSACSTGIILSPVPVQTYRLRVVLGGSGGGEVLSSRSNSGPTIGCNLSTTPAGGTCEVEAPIGTVFKLMPYKNSSSFVAGFSGTICTFDSSVSNENVNCTFTLNSDLDVTAVFQAQVAPLGSQGLPLFSNIVISNIGRNSALITWTTSKAADSRVRYGTTTAYNTHTSLEPTLKTSHSVVMNNLLPNTTYNFRALSRDITGLMNSSNNFSFTTLP